MDRTHIKREIRRRESVRVGDRDRQRESLRVCVCVRASETDNSLRYCEDFLERVHR